MDLIQVYNKVDMQTRLNVLSEILTRDMFYFGKNTDCVKIQVKSVYDYPTAEFQIIEKFDLLRDDCLLMTKDLFCFLKTLPYSDGIYLITKYHIPILEIRIGNPGTIVDTIEITDYIKRLETNQSFTSWICNLFGFGG